MWHSSKVNKLNQVIRLFIFSLFILLGITGSEAAVKDSVGVKVKEGKIYIMHKVDPGQGLYSVSRRYNVPIEDILKANPQVKEMLQNGQILLIPTGKDAPFEEQMVKEYFDEKKTNSNEKDTETVEVSSTFARYHRVQAGETLYSVARKYNTSVEVIRDLNNITGDALSEGQRLLVPVREDGNPLESGQGDDDKSDERITELEEELVELRKRIQGDEKSTSDTIQKAMIKPKYEKKVDKVEKYNIEKVSEKGVIQILTDKTIDQQQRYASHHEAEIGTIIMVTNPSSGQSVFVKVISNHPLNDSKTNMIMLTRSAAEKINVSSGASVEISYAR